MNNQRKRHIGRGTEWSPVQEHLSLWSLLEGATSGHVDVFTNPEVPPEPLHLAFLWRFYY